MYNIAGSYLEYLDITFSVRRQYLNETSIIVLLKISIILVVNESK